MTLVLLGIVSIPMVSCLLNVLNQTDEVLKLKDCDSDDESSDKKQGLTWSQFYDFVYGKDCPLYKAIFASFF